MTRKAQSGSRSRFWITLIIILILAALAYYFFYYKDRPETREEPAETKPVPSEPKTEKEGPQPELPVETREVPSESEEEDQVISSVTHEETPETTPPETEEVYCTRVRNNVLEFFKYLDNQEYIQKRDLGKDTYSWFKDLMRKLAANPPHPAGEGQSGKAMLKNLFYFFRLLDKGTVNTIRAVMEHEKDTAELNLKIFYEWLSLEDRCPDPDDVRPSFEVQYRYAGFFLNTTGGRAYLHRRPSHVRLLTRYYCLLIVHKADKTGRNNWGIDIFPMIASLADEISRYPELRFQGEYLTRLDRMERYYRNRR